MSKLLSDESGISLIHVAILLPVLMGLGAVVTDFGVMYVAREQAQNAADAAALSGAVARAFDEPGPSPVIPMGAAYQSALHIARAHSIFGEQPSVPDITFPT